MYRSMSHVLAIDQALVASKTFPEILHYVAVSSHFKQSLLNPVSSNASLEWGHVVSWHA